MFNQTEKQVILTELPSRVGDSMKETPSKPTSSFQSASLERRAASEYPKIKVDDAIVKRSIKEVKFD